MTAGGGDSVLFKDETLRGYPVNHHTPVCNRRATSALGGLQKKQHVRLGGTPTGEERECSQGMMGNGFEASFKPSGGWETAVEEAFVL